MSVPEATAAGRLMVAFSGVSVPDDLADWVAAEDVAGVTLFRFHNVVDATQVRALTTQLQARRRATEPLLVAADQECGQLLALGDDTTPFAGNLALGAVDDVDLTRRVGEAMGRELRAVGVTVNYAPVCDVAVNPDNPALGGRAFGDAPEAVARHAAALTAGLQAVGVAATLKHFPGKGRVSQDTHHGSAAVDGSRADLDAVELPPFVAGIAAGARLVMSGHHAVPGLTGAHDLPATVSGAVMSDLLRTDLGYEGVTITDSLDMRALAQGAGQQVIEAVAAMRAGVDLLLCPPDLAICRSLSDGIDLAARRGLLAADAFADSRARIAALRRWTAGFDQPELDVVGCDAHAVLARELAERSVTLVRDDAGLLPLRLADGDRVAVIQPTPTDLTPADTSSAVEPRLAAAIAAHHGTVDELVVAHAPSRGEIADVRDAVADHDLVVVGTVDARRQPGQAAMVAALLDSGTPMVTVALRTPWDLDAYPQAPTHVCAYSILEPSLDALAAALFGAIAFQGRLPVELGGRNQRRPGVAV